MRESMEQAFAEALKESPERFLEVMESSHGRLKKSVVVKVLKKCNKSVATGICDALVDHVSRALELFESSEEDADVRCESLETLRGYAWVVQVGLAKAFQPNLLYPAVLLLHDSLVKFEEDQELQDSIATICETWWRNDLEEKQSLVAQSLPFLVSRSLESGRKGDVRRVYGVRDALALFDFADESIEDLKHLLIRCMLTPLYLRSPEGCRFLSFLFGLNPRLVKELVVIVRSQIPFSPKSILATYGEILYRAWKDSEDACLREIEDNCIQGLIEAAIYASDKALASAVRKVLDAFISRKAQDEVEAMLFRLHEPIFFRALQVANSDVRRNALVLLIEVFPLQDPRVSKEEKEALLEKQFSLLEKLLMDPCPDVRSVAVEGVCRILRYFWEILPSPTTVRLLTVVMDEMAHDQSSIPVRLAVIAGITYLLENPQSHGLLQALLPRLGSMLDDTSLSIRIAVADMLLAIKGIRSLHFYKVAKLDFLLSCLASDNSQVVRRLTRLLIPSYLPSKLPPPEACQRCVKLIRRSPDAGANFCKWALAEGASPDLLLELVKALSSSDILGDTGGEPGTNGIMTSLQEICCCLAAEKDGLKLLVEIFNVDALTSLLNRASTAEDRSAILRIACLLPATDVPTLIGHCGKIVLGCKAPSPGVVQEMQAVHSLILAWGGFDEFVAALIKLLKCIPQKGTCSPRNPDPNMNQGATLPHKGRKRRKSPWLQVMAVKFRSDGQNQDSGTGVSEESLENNLVAAVGAAWQVEKLLEQEETREAVLSCGALVELTHCLREVVEISVLQTCQSSEVCGNMEVPSVVLAYAKLSMHVALKQDITANSEAPESFRTSSKGKRRQTFSRTPSTVASPHLKSVDAVIEELVVWASQVLKAPLPAGSKPAQNSPPPLQPKAKYARKSSRKQRVREPLQASSPGGKDRLQVLNARASALAVTLQSALEAHTLKLVTSTCTQESFALFARKAVAWTRAGLESFREASAGDDASVSPVAPKDFTTYVKMIAAYSAKMVYVTLRQDRGLRSHMSALAHSLLDLLAVSDSIFGSQSPVAAAVRPWLPDLLISVTSVLQPQQGQDTDAVASTEQQFDAFAYDDSRALRPWICNCAQSAFLSREDGDGGSAVEEQPDHESDSKSSDLREEGMSAPVSICLDTVFKLLRKGNSLVAKEIVAMLVQCTGVLFCNQEYSQVVGLLAVLCRKVLCCSPTGKTGLDVRLSDSTIAELERIQVQVTTDLASEDISFREELKTAEKLVRLILTCYPASLA